MAIVNKFNVNKQEVTLDADIIENMSANNVSYNSSLQYDENNVGDKLSKLNQQVIYDVTSNNDEITFASLSALLSSENLSTLIPISVRCGGMSIRFVQSSDNKYVQYRLMNQNFTTDTTQWQGVDDEPTAGSDNLVKSGGVAFAINKELYKVQIKSWEDVGLLDKNYYLTGNGGKVSNPSWSISDFIRVSEGDVFNYKLTGYLSMVYLYAFYNELKEYISDSSHVGSSTTEVGSVTIPAGVSYIRFCGKFNEINPTDTYDSNGEALLAKHITSVINEIKSNIDNISSSIETLESIKPDVEKLDDAFVKSINLFNKETVRNYGSYGEQYGISDYIEVKPNVIYTVNGIYGYEIFKYSEDKVFIEKIRIDNGYQIENAFQEDVKYICIVLLKSNKDYMFFYEGICQGAYVPYGRFVEIPNQQDKHYDRVVDYNNLWNPKEYGENASLSYTSGVVRAAEVSYVSPYIIVNVSETYLLSKYSNHIICSYNANKEFVRCISRTGDEHPITIQEGEIYVRISGATSKIDNPDFPAMIFYKKKDEFNKIQSYNTYVQKNKHSPKSI